MRSGNDGQDLSKTRQSGSPHNSERSIIEPIRHYRRQLSRLRWHIFLAHRNHASMVLIVRNNQLFFLWALPIQFIPIFFSPLAEVAVTLDWIRFCLNLVLINGLLLWCYRLYWQYQTFHLPSTSINRVEWFGDLAEKKRKWMAAGYTPGRIRWETLKYYKEIIRAGLTVIVIDTAVYDYWCQLRGWCTPDYEE